MGGLADTEHSRWGPLTTFPTATAQVQSPGSFES